MRISPHFFLHEFTVSQVGERLNLDNTPYGEHHDNIHNLAWKMETVREILGNVPIFITSGYRSQELNKAIGGSSNSQHCKGQAVDFIAPRFGIPKLIAQRLANTNPDELPFDQLIFEGKKNGGWVHLSFSENPRRSVLTAEFRPGSVVYKEGIV